MSTKPLVLVADDDAGIRIVLSQALDRAGFEVRTTGNMATLWNWVNEGEGDLVITDVIMPDENGLDLIPRILKIRPGLRTIVMSAQNTLLTAIRATERGAFDYLPKPFDLEELVSLVKRALELPHAARSPRGLLTERTQEESLPLIGRSPAMQEIYRVLARIMNSNLTVTIVGESGTGKELVARALHDYSKRQGKNFIAINMAAIPQELIESELFGHEKGAFTGALQKKSGRFEQATGGTLFMDEIGDMPEQAQTRLLRVLQEGEYTTVGGREPIKTDVRIIAATHRDLRQLIDQGQFREDLYYRLNVIPIRIPPLRERTEDIPELVSYFLEKAARQTPHSKVLDKEAMAYLGRYHWPGNVRELENLIQRLCALYSQDLITVNIVKTELEGSVRKEEELKPTEGLSECIRQRLKSYFSMHEGTLPASGLYNRVLKEVEKPLISMVLEATKGNQIRAAEVLGLNRNTLRTKIKALDIPVIRKSR